MKLYTNPYQSEVWESMKQTQKEKDEIDNEIVYALAKIMAFFMSIGVIYLLFRQ
jgi:hypothetical protein